MKVGISTSLKTGSDAACLKANGIDFVFRYYSKTTSINGKRLTIAEAQVLTASGIEIGVVYEDGPTGTVYFTNARGQQDGANAGAYAQQINQPKNSCIYFAVDFGARNEDMPAIIDYFRGVRVGLDAATAGQPGYDIGVYGGGTVCNTIKQLQGLATYSWLAESTAWLGTSTYVGWDVMQRIAKAPLCSLRGQHDGQEGDYEECMAQDTFGGFTLGAATAFISDIEVAAGSAGRTMSRTSTQKKAPTRTPVKTTGAKKAMKKKPFAKRSSSKNARPQRGC